MNHARARRLTSVAAMIALVSAAGVMACPPDGTASGGSLSDRTQRATPFWGTDITNGLESRPSGVPVGVAQADLTENQQKLLGEHNKRRIAIEKQLNVLRRTHFDNITNAKRRAEGIVALKQFIDPAVYPSLLKIFERDGQDVRGAVLDMLAAQRSSDADATLAWASLFDKDEWFRDQAGARLATRVKSEGGKTPMAVESAVAAAFMTRDPQAHIRAGQLAQNLGLIQAIPAMIHAQAGQTGGANRYNTDGYLATILIGHQVAFVADLTPIVGDSAVGFDPEIGVVTEGVVLNIQDAAVTWHNVALHNQLAGWTSALTGHNTSGLGWNVDAWDHWYATEFMPQLTRQTQLAMALRGGADETGASRTPGRAE